MSDSPCVDCEEPADSPAHYCRFDFLGGHSYRGADHHPYMSRARRDAVEAEVNSRKVLQETHPENPGNWAKT